MITRHDNERALRRAAFTLMEILVVVAIIVALAGVGGYFLIGQLQTSKEGVAKLQAKKLADACDIYFTRNQRYPADLNTLLDPTQPGGAILKDKNAVIDPWGVPYTMSQNQYGIVIVSMGAGHPISSAD